MDATDSLKYIILFSQILGVFPFEVKKSVGGLTFVESATHFTYCKILFGFSFLVTVTHMYWSTTFLGKGFSISSEITATLVVIIFSVTYFLAMPVLARMVILKKNWLRFWLNKLRKVFSLLSEEEIKKLRTTSGVCLFFSFGSLLVLGIMDATIPKETIRTVANATHTTDMFLMYSTVINFYLITTENKLMLQQFLIFVNMIRSHYMETNKLLGTMGTDWRVWADCIRHLRCRDMEVHDFIDFLHSFFTPILTLQFSWGFYAVLFNFVVSLKFGLPSVLQIAWVVVLFWDLISAATLCYFTEKEAQKTLHSLQNSFMYCDNAKVNEEVELFSLQVQHRRVGFYLMGLVKIDLTLIYAFIGSLTSYAVIFMNLKGESSKGKACYVKMPENCTSAS